MSDYILKIYDWKRRCDFAIWINGFIKVNPETTSVAKSGWTAVKKAWYAELFHLFRLRCWNKSKVPSSQGCVVLHISDHLRNLIEYAYESGHTRSVTKQFVVKQLIVELKLHAWYIISWWYRWTQTPCFLLTALNEMVVESFTWRRSCRTRQCRSTRKIRRKGAQLALAWRWRKCWR